MTALRGWFSAPRPWHLMLGPAVPLLGLLRHNTDSWPPDVIIVPALVAVSVALLLWLAIASFAHDPRRAALAVTFLMLAGMSHLPVLRAALMLGSPRFVLVIHLAVLLGAVAIVRSHRPSLVATAFANRALLAAVVLLTLPIVWGEVTRTRVVAEPLGGSPASASGPRPDVYVLILDGYARADVLRDLYGFENPLPDALRAAGFFVANGATANYAQTALSLASAFNLDYLPQLGHPHRAEAHTRRGLEDLIRTGRIFRAFENAGYGIRAYGSEYSMIRPDNAGDVRDAPGHLNEFGYAMLEATVVPTLFEAAGLPRGWLPLRLHRHHLRWTLSDLAEHVPAQGSGPALVVAHLLAPHPPFAVDAAGGIRNTRLPALLQDGSMWREIAQQSNESYKDGYLDGVRYLNDGILRVAQAIVNRPSRPAIVLIHSDHGSGLELQWENPGETNMRERMGVLLAAHFPGGHDPAVDDRVTLVNAYRTVMNRALGTRLPALENRSYFSTWTQPFAYLDVTNRLHCADCAGSRPTAVAAVRPPAGQ